MVCFSSFLIADQKPSYGVILLGTSSYTTNNVKPYFHASLDYGGYSDWIYYQQSTLHPYSSHELLSGEWGAAIYYDGIDTDPIDPLFPAGHVRLLG